MTTATDARKWTWSSWVKRGLFGASAQAGLIASGNSTTDGSGVTFSYGTGEFLAFYDYISSTFTTNLLTTQVFRDPSAWYHIVVAVDTTQATASNRVKLYVNGTQITSFSTAVYPALNSTGYMNSGTFATTIGREGGFGNYYDGYMTEMNFVDGQQLTPSSFGSTNALTGVWQPARYTGTYGTNGFYLPFTDNSALTTSSNVGLGRDYSGNGNYWTTNNISITAGVTYDSMTDVPTLTSATAANFAVLNPLGNAISTAVSSQISNANLKYSGSSGGGCAATMALPAGKYYFETTISAIYGLFVGLGTDARNLQSDYGLVNTNIYGWYINPTINLVNNGTSTTWTSNTVSTGTVINLAIDASNLSSVKVWLGKANVWYDSSAGTTGDPSTGANPTLTITAGINLYPNLGFFGGGTSTIEANFGQRPFTYTPPTGFVALNTYNLPTSTIVKGSDNMNIALAAGASIKTTTEALFTGQFLEWIKDRANANNHQLLNGVTGLSAVLQSNTTAAETTYSAPSGNSVGWAWKAGSSSSSNTNGSITSTVSVNASAGFSVVTYTGTGANATVGHGLGVAPQFINIKKRSSTGNWITYHSSVALNGSSFVALNSTAAAVTSSAQFNNTAPTSSVFTVGTDADTNGSTQTFVAYCWTPIAGFSAFGSFAANGSADNAFVYTGFKPKYILMKQYDSASFWFILDSVRNTYNPADKELFAQIADAESTFTDLDFLSNGFKIRRSGISGNWIYAAFASNPFKNSLAF
jgi:hypothetical protein